MRPITPLLAIQKPKAGNAKAEANDAKAEALEPLCVSLQDLAKLTSLSIRHLRRLDSSGDIPGKITSGRRIVFRYSAIKQWVCHGLPGRTRWDLLVRTGQVKGGN